MCVDGVGKAVADALLAERATPRGAFTSSENVRVRLWKHAKLRVRASTLAQFSLE